MVSTTRIDGKQCRTTKVRPDFYTAEVWTDCLDKNGNAVTIPTNHTDPSILGGFLAFFGAVAAGAAF